MLQLDSSSQSGNASTWFEQSVMCFRLQNHFTAITSVVLVTARAATLPSHMHACPHPCLWCLLAAGDLAAGEACPKDREMVKGRTGLQVLQTLSGWLLNGKQHPFLSNGRGSFLIPEYSCQYPEQRKTVHQPGDMRGLCTDREQQVKKVSIRYPVSSCHQMLMLWRKVHNN